MDWEKERERMERPEKTRRGRCWEMGDWRAQYRALRMSAQ